MQGVSAWPVRTEDAPDKDDWRLAIKGLTWKVAIQWCVWWYLMGWCQGRYEKFACKRMHRLATNGLGKSSVHKAADPGSFNQCVCVCVCFVWKIFIVFFYVCICCLLKKTHAVDALGHTADSRVCQYSTFSDVALCKYLWKIYRLRRLELSAFPPVLFDYVVFVRYIGIMIVL